MFESETQWMPHIDRLAKAKPADADRIWVLLSEALGGHSPALDVASVLAHVGRLSVGARLRPGKGPVPRAADQIVSNLVPVEVGTGARGAAVVEKRAGDHRARDTVSPGVAAGGRGPERCKRNGGGPSRAPRERNVAPPPRD